MCTLCMWPGGVGEEAHGQAACPPSLVKVLRAWASRPLERSEALSGGKKMAFGLIPEICEDSTA